MKVKVPLGLLLLLAAIIGYLLGTEKGRQQRDQVVGKIRNRGASDELAEEGEELAEAGEGLVETAPAAVASQEPPPDDGAE